MSRVFDLHHTFRGFSPGLLGEFFRRRGELLKVPWDGPRLNGAPQPHLEWMKLPKSKRLETQLIFHDIHSLADHRGLKVMAEEVNRHCPHRRDEFMAHTACLDKAMWFHLNLSKAFEQATLFALADALSVGKDFVRRDDLPKTLVRVRAPRVALLEKELRNHFWKEEMRGEHCKVRHYARGGDTLYFFAYLDDWPDKRLVFRDDGKMVRRHERFAFQIVFTYCGKDGALEVIAQGAAKNPLPLQQAFCNAILDIPNVAAVDPLKPSYRLGMLLDPRFTYPTEPVDHISRARLVRIRMHPINAQEELDHIELKFRPDVRRTEWLEIIHRTLKANRLNTKNVVVKQATFQVTIAGTDGERDKPLSWNVTVPHTCNLKSRPDELRLVGEHCNKKWGIVDE